MKLVLHIKVRSESAAHEIVALLEMALHEAVSRNRTGSLERTEVSAGAVNMHFRNRGSGCTPVLEQYLKHKKVDNPWFIASVTPKGRYSLKAANHDVHDPKEEIEVAGPYAEFDAELASVTGRKNQVLKVTIPLSEFPGPREALEFEDRITDRVGDFAIVDGNEIGEGEVSFWLYCSSATYVARMVGSLLDSKSLALSRMEYRRKRSDDGYLRIEL